MLFDSAEKWWPTEGERPTGHEGLDLCLFQDEHGNLRELVAPIQGPAAMDGKLVKIMLDFLDLSIVVYHGEFSDAEWGFSTIYAHTAPKDSTIEGEKIEEGAPIAPIQKTKPMKNCESCRPAYQHGLGP
jgi:hypothetical protein